MPNDENFPYKRKPSLHEILYPVDVCLKKVARRSRKFIAREISPTEAQYLFQVIGMHCCMCKFNANGFIVQDMSAPTGVVKNFHYAGINAFHLYPLSERHDAKSRHLTDQIFSYEIAENEFQILEFISNPNLLTQYIALCEEYSIPIRLLFVESSFERETWGGNYPSGNTLGYEYCTIPLDEQIITDIDWYPPFSRYWGKLNSCGLFSTFDEAKEFKDRYNDDLEKQEIGDDEMEAYIFRVTEVKDI